MLSNLEKASCKTLPEYKIALAICSKIKDAAKVLASDNPFHKNGVKFSIPKQVYHYILNEELVKKNLIRHSEDKVKEFVEKILTKVN
jgi:RNA-binding protein YhbY